MERDLKQLSRGLDGINRALKKKKRKKWKRNVKTKKLKCSSFFVSKTTCFVVVVFCLLLLFLLFLLSFLFDGPLGIAGLVTQYVYLAFGCESTQTRTAASTSA